MLCYRCCLRVAEMSTYCQKNTSKSFLQELLLICSFSIMMIVFALELQIKWRLAGLAFFWLSLNRLKSVFEAFCNFNITSLKSSPTRNRVFSSSYLEKSTLFITKNKPHHKILNKRGSKFDPSGTANKNPSYEPILRLS